MWPSLYFPSEKFHSEKFREKLKILSLKLNCFLSFLNETNTKCRTEGFEVRYNLLLPKRYAHLSERICNVKRPLLFSKASGNYYAPLFAHELFKEKETKTERAHDQYFFFLLPTVNAHVYFRRLLCERLSRAM